MRKSDFIDFIHESVTTPNHSPNTRETILQNANRQDRRRRRKIDITKMLLYILYPLLFHLETL